MTDSSTSKSTATRRGFLGLVAKVSAGVAGASTLRPDSPALATPGRRHVSQETPLSDGVAHRKLATMKWSEPYVSKGPALTQEEVQAEWGQREQNGVPWEEVLRRRRKAKR